MSKNAKSEPRFELLPISEVELLDDNPRIISKKEMAELRKDIRKDPNFLMQRPPLLNYLKKENRKVCYAGNQRVKAAMEEGMTDIWCWIEDDVPKVLQDERMLKDNLHRGVWDFEKLAFFDATFLNNIGFANEELNKIFTDIGTKEDPEFNLEESLDAISIPTTQLGQIYHLGRHRLMCGDATNLDHVKQLCNSELIKLVVTDPPYNVNYEGGTKDKLTIKNDDMSSGEFLKFLTDSISNMISAMAEGAMIYIFHSDTEGENFRTALRKSGAYFSQSCVWVKNTFVMGRQDYHWQHEPILVGWKQGIKHSWYGGRKQSTVWNFNKPLRNEEHPTMKPVELISYPIMNSSKPGDSVLDLFGGSGSTIISCEQTQRTGYVMELDPIFCDVIVKRWEAFTGMKAKLIK